MTQDIVKYDLRLRCPGVLLDQIDAHLSELLQSKKAIFGGNSFSVFPDGHTETCYIKNGEEYHYAFDVDDRKTIETWDRYVIRSHQEAVEEIEAYKKAVTETGEKTHHAGLVIFYRDQTDDVAR